MASTDVFACVREQGVAELHAVPEPVGETKTVAETEAWAAVGVTKAAETRKPVAAAIVAVRRRPTRPW
ncbi:hypothetical protein ACQ4WX_50335 [Streptomyces lasalocidi]